MQFVFGFVDETKIGMRNLNWGTQIEPRYGRFYQELGIIDDSSEGYKVEKNLPVELCDENSELL